MDNMIETSGLAKSYRRRPALRGIDLVVPRGVVCGYLEPNGAGKTTTIRILVGLIRPTAGRAEVLGMDVVRRREEVQRRIGYLPGEWVHCPLTLTVPAGCHVSTWGATAGKIVCSRPPPTRVAIPEPRGHHGAFSRVVSQLRSIFKEFF